MVVSQDLSSGGRNALSKLLFAFIAQKPKFWRENTTFADLRDIPVRQFSDRLRGSPLANATKLVWGAPMGRNGTHMPSMRSLRLTLEYFWFSYKYSSPFKIHTSQAFSLQQPQCKVQHVEYKWVLALCNTEDTCHKSQAPHTCP